MNVLDVKCLLDVERYRKINVAARAPGAVYPNAHDSSPQRNVGFLEQCVRRLPAVNFVERASGRVYLRIESGVPAWHDPAGLATALRDPDTAAGVNAVVPGALADNVPVRTPAPLLQVNANGRHEQTLGDWNAN